MIEAMVQIMLMLAARLPPSLENHLFWLPVAAHVLRLISAGGNCVHDIQFIAYLSTNVEVLCAVTLSSVTSFPQQFYYYNLVLSKNSVSWFLQLAWPLYKA